MNVHESRPSNEWRAKPDDKLWTAIYDVLHWLICETGAELPDDLFRMRHDGLIRVTRKIVRSRPSTVKPKAPLYSIGTSGDVGYTPQIGLSVPSINMTRAQLRVAIRELRGMAYSAHRTGSTKDGHEDFSPGMLVLRTDGESAYDVLMRLRNW